MDPILVLAGAAAAVGVFSHLSYFINGEHAIRSPTYFATAIILPSTIVAALVKFGGVSLLNSVALVTLCFSAYLGALFTSMLFYRVFLHPLKDFPGPFPAKLSKLWWVAQIAPKIDHFRKLDRLHQQYGEFVRTGPNEVSISDPSAVEIVHGPKTRCYKADWYDLGLPLTTLHQMRDRVMHDKRRKLGWDKAFSIKSLRSYENRVTSYADVLVEQMTKSVGKPVDASKWFIHYTFDVMGDLAFGRSFDALKNGRSHSVMDIMHGSAAAVGVFGTATWVLRLLSKMPKAFNPVQKLIDYSESCVEERKKMKIAEPDILSHLLESEQTEPMFNNAEENKLLLTGDARLIIVAGSDTTATTLAFTFYHLAKDPSQQQKIRDELKQMSGGDGFDFEALRNMLHLNGVINEALRLHPPVPGGVWRYSAPEGIKVGDHYIPGNVTVLTPIYTIQRCKSTPIPLVLLLLLLLLLPGTPLPFFHFPLQKPPH